MFDFLDNIVRKFQSQKKIDRESGLSRWSRSRKLHLEFLEERCVLTTLFVDADVVSPGSGASWSTAFSSLQSALEYAQDTSRNITEIWIAEGTYTPTVRTNYAEARSETFALIDGVSLYGGFAGTETSLAGRAKNSDGSFVHETILSGDLAKNDDFQDPNSLLDNAYSVLYGSSMTQGLTLDGLTITAGNASLSSVHSGTVPAYWTSGGGIALVNCNNMTLSNLQLSGNQADQYGGALYVDRGKVSLTNSRISGNSAGQQGGGIHVLDGDLVIVSSYLLDNYAEFRGGGLSQTYGTLNVSSSMISGNTAWYGGGFYQSGGSATFLNASLIGNVAADRYADVGLGGAVYQQGTLFLTNVTCSQNVAGYGGAFFVENSISAATAIGTYSNLTISKNIATAAGGGIRINSGTVTINNSIVAANTAVSGLDISGETKPITIFSGSNNLIGVGVGIPALPSGSTAKAIQNGVNGNQVGSAASPLDPKLGAPTDLGNNILVLPVLSGSPVLGRGNTSLIPSGVTTDARGQSRTTGSTVDIGAVEGSTASKSAVTYLVTSLADEIKNDGILTFREAFEAANFNKQVGDAPAGSFTESDVIKFADGLNGTIVLNGVSLQIFGGMTIQGSGMNLVSIDAQGKSGVIKAVGSVNIGLSGLTLKNGLSETNGGGILAYHATLSLNNLAVRDSRVSTLGLGGGVYIKNGTLDANDFVLSGNFARNGGGLYQNNTQSTLINVSFYDNASKEEGGAFYQQYGNSLFANATIARNESPFGGGLVFLEATSKLTHLSVTRNLSDTVGGMVVGSKSTVVLTNSIVADNFSYGTTDIFVYRNTTGDNGMLSGSCNLIGDGTGMVGLVDGTNGNIVGTHSSPKSPGFASPSYYNGQLTYPLSETSLAVDAGNYDNSVGKGTTKLTTDVRGSGYQRLSGTKVDLGACERQGSLVPRITAASHAIRLGQTLELTGSVTGQSNITYLWDFNNNGLYGESGSAATQGEETEKTATFNSTGAVRDPVAPYKARLIVVDGSGNRSDPIDWDINILNGLPCYSIIGPSSFSQDEAQKWRIDASNAQEDPIVSWTIQWGDGSENTVIKGGPRNTIFLSHVYHTAGVFSLQVTTESLFGEKYTFSLTTFQVHTKASTLSLAAFELSDNSEMLPQVAAQNEAALPVADESDPAVLSFLTPTFFQETESSEMASSNVPQTVDIATLALYEQATAKAIVQWAESDEYWFQNSDRFRLGE